MCLCISKNATLRENCLLSCDLKISIIVPLNLKRTVVLTQELMIARYFQEIPSTWLMFSIFDEVSTEYFFFFFFHFPASAGNHLYQFVFPGTINLMNFPSLFWRSNVSLWLVFKMWFTGTKMSKLSKFELFWGETITFSIPFLLKFSVKNMSLFMLVTLSF